MNGGVRCWGDNTSKQLGDDTSGVRSYPPEIDVVTGAQAVVAGAGHSCALLTTGRVVCWGSGASANEYRSMPTPELEICP
jgi:alpha-tubulin suppressor-like RCC1 family protein